jgi:hypothetical protein
MIGEARCRSRKKPRLMILAEQWRAILEQSVVFVVDDGRN